MRFYVHIFVLEIHHCGTGVLQIRTVCVTWPSLAISYASMTNYSKTQYWKRHCCCQKFLYFLSDFFFHSKKRAFPHSTLHPFFPLHFPFHLHFAHSLWLLVEVLSRSVRVDCFCQRLSDVILELSKKRTAWVWFVVVWRPKALPKGCSCSRQEDLISEI